MKNIKHLYVPIRNKTARISICQDGKIVHYQTTGDREFKMVAAVAQYDDKRRSKPREQVTMVAP